MVLVMSAICFFLHLYTVKRNLSSVAIGKPERYMRKASHCGSKQQ